MQQLKEFCREYLPKYFSLKFKRQRIKEPFFDYRKGENVFELTTNVFSLIDHLHAANPSLEPTQYIQNYFLFRFQNFYKECEDMVKVPDDEGYHAIIKILEGMKNRTRECFQIYIRLVYLYFQSKQKQADLNPKKIFNRDQCYQSLPVLYTDLKIKTMTGEDSQADFVLIDFMEYAIKLLLNMKPNQKFFNYVIDIIQQCGFPEMYQQKIMDKIKQVKLKQQRQEIKKYGFALKDKIYQMQNSAPSQKCITETQTKIDSNQGTPVKQEASDKTDDKTDMKTLQTSQKKHNVIIRHRHEDRNELESVKTSLKLQRKPTTPFKQRTLYMRSKYFVSKNTLMNNSKVPSHVSKLNQIQESRFNQLNRSYSSRCLDVKFQQEQQVLAGATPKPKKKVKTQAVETSQKFDQNGNFIKRR